MRKILLFAATALVMTNFSSCKEEPCKKNNTGDVIITNNTEETLWFDVTGDDGIKSENRSVSPGARTTYTIAAGSAKIWASYTDSDNNFILVHTQSLYQCETIDFQMDNLTKMNGCFEHNTGDVIITNNTNETLWFDVTGNDGITTENRSLKSGASTTYTIPIGTANIWASYINDNDYFMLVSSQSLAQCGVINFQTPSRTCELFQTTDITIINNTGEDKYFGVWIYDETQENEGFLLEDQYIASGKEYTYYDVYIGDGWASFEFKDGDTWYATNDDYEIYACKPFTFTWNAKKSNDKVVSKRRLERTSLTRVRKTKQ